MKLILGDNQFFGVNHFDLKKGDQTKNNFTSIDLIAKFIKESLNLGMDGFMINSNEIGYQLINKKMVVADKEVHYSVPYPHKYANMVNEKGMMSLFSFLVKNSAILGIIESSLRFITNQNLKSLVPPALDLEIPKNLPKGSYVYLQNIITDLLIGMDREDILIQFIRSVRKKGFKPGIITLNPVLINELLEKSDLLKENWISELIVCFNINVSGFNVFPTLDKVEDYINHRPKYKTMGMSIFASGGASIQESIDYIKSLPLDYVVFGTSKLENLQSNVQRFKLNT